MSTKMQVGLGEAIERHNTLHKRMSAGLASKEERDEYTLLSTALNEIKLDLGFDCNDDGVPDTIEIFHQTAQTSCCRFVPAPPKRKRGRPVGSKNKTSTSKTVKASTKASTKATSTKKPSTVKRASTAKKKTTTTKKK